MFILSSSLYESLILKTDEVNSVVIVRTAPEHLCTGQQGFYQRVYAYTITVSNIR